MRTWLTAKLYVLAWAGAMVACTNESESDFGPVVGALADSSFCGDSGSECIELSELSKGCIGSHREQMCMSSAGDFTVVDGYLYFDEAGRLAAVERAPDPNDDWEPGWYGLNLDDCEPISEERQVPCNGNASGA